MKRESLCAAVLCLCSCLTYHHGRRLHCSPGPYLAGDPNSSVGGERTELVCECIKYTLVGKAAAHLYSTTISGISINEILTSSLAPVLLTSGQTVSQSVKHIWAQPFYTSSETFSKHSPNLSQTANKEKISLALAHKSLWHRLLQLFVSNLF